MKSWKTSVAGIATASGYLFLTYLQQGIKPRDAAIAAGLVAIGMLAKDSDVSHAPVPMAQAENVHTGTGDGAAVQNAPQRKE